MLKRIYNLVALFWSFTIESGGLCRQEFFNTLYVLKFRNTQLFSNQTIISIMSYEAFDHKQKQIKFGFDCVSEMLVSISYLHNYFKNYLIHIQSTSNLYIYIKRVPTCITEACIPYIPCIAYPTLLT